MNVLAALISAIFATSKDICSKKLASEVDSSVSTLASFAYALPYYSLVLALCSLFGFDQFNTLPHFYAFIVLRSLSDACAESMKMKALSSGDLSVVSSLLSLYPIFLLIASPLISGDPVSRATIYSTVVIVCGTIVILYKPRNSKEKSIPLSAIFFSLLAAVFFSLNTSLDRMAAQTGTPIYSGFCMTLMAAIFVLPTTLRSSNWKGQLFSEWRSFSLRGFFEIGFMVAKLAALQSLSAPFVVALLRLSVLFSIFGGKVIFKEKHFAQRLVGGLLVVAGIIWAVLYTH